MWLEIYAAALSLMGANAPDQNQPPVRLVAEQQDGRIELRVMGESDRPVEAAYALEVVSDRAAGANRTVQRGRVNLVPGVPETLMTLRMGISDGAWTARLRVEPTSGAAYEEVRRSLPEG